MLPEYRSDDRHPFVSLLYLVVFCVIGSVVFTAIGVLICYFIYGNKALTALTGGTPAIEVIKIIQVFSSIGTFVLPAFYFGKHESADPVAFLKLNKPFNIKLIALATAIVFMASPFIEWTIQVNQMMKLPGFLKGLEDWMRAKEDQLELLTKQLLVMKTVPDLLIILFVVAVVPALGEEFIFRGCVQKIFAKWTESPHAGIWISAAIFSAIHFQFYGFIPRMILGALFGYLFLWSKNLWVPVTAHFINNGSAVVSAWVIQKRGESIENIDRPVNYETPLPMISILITIALMALFFRLSNKEDKDLLNERLG